MRGQEARDAARKAAMAALAQATRDELGASGTKPACPRTPKRCAAPRPAWSRVRGRIGGGGAPFNLGEATVTRATVRLPAGADRPRLCARPRQGEGAARRDRSTRSGSDRRHARRRSRPRSLAPLRDGRPRPTRKRRAETAATKVDFFTMVRGED